MTQEIVQSTTGGFMPVMAIQDAIARRNAIVEFVKAIMRPDIDYGTIPGTQKPTLLKPGAEKLNTLFGLCSRFIVTDKETDWTGIGHNGEPFFYFVYRCQLWHGELLVAESDGSCNSMEKKYRYRSAERVCPKCGKATIRLSKKNPEWYCWQKIGGCGATFPSKDMAIVNQEVGQVVNTDIAEQVNTIQKMAQKRALIGATLLAVNASEFFAQDLEDLDGNETNGEGKSAAVPANSSGTDKPGRNSPAGDADLSKPVDKAEQARARIRMHGKVVADIADKARSTGHIELADTMDLQLAVARNALNSNSTLSVSELHQIADQLKALEPPEEK